jgi:hypothetical protein
LLFFRLAGALLGHVSPPMLSTSPAPW